MERRFLVGSKSFALSVLEGASVLRMEEKRQGFYCTVVLSIQCSAWFALMMESLLGFPGDQEFIKSFREGSKILIACRVGNKDGRFLKAVAYGLGGRRGIILILEGRGGWGWHKFFGELRKASDFLFATVGCGSGSSDATVNQGGKDEGEMLGLTFERMGPSFAAVVRSASVSVARMMPIVGGRHPG
jgi:hypothetical protein